MCSTKASFCSCASNSPSLMHVETAMFFSPLSSRKSIKRLCILLCMQTSNFPRSHHPGYLVTKGSPNPPTQLVSIALNMVPHKQKAELTGELMRREKNMKKPDLMQESLRENQNKRRGDWREKRERRKMIGQQFILKKPSIGDVVSISSVYMTWQVQKLLVVSWIGIVLSHARTWIAWCPFISHHYSATSLVHSHQFRGDTLHQLKSFSMEVS